MLGNNLLSSAQHPRRAYGLEPEIWGRIEPDPQAVALGLGQPGTSLFVASPEQTNSHSSGASYLGEQGYNVNAWQFHSSYPIDA